LRLYGAAGLEAGAEEIELRFGGGGRDEFEKRIAAAGCFWTER